MDFLTDEQNANFAAINARLGLGPDEFTCQEAAESLASMQGLVRMHTTGESEFVPHILPVGCVEDMQKIVGAPQGDPLLKGEAPPIPPPPSSEDRRFFDEVSQSDLKAQLPSELKGRIVEAATAFVLGDAEAVIEYENMINQTMYPGRVGVFTGETLTVAAGATLEINGGEPAVVNFGRIILGEGATLRILTPFSIHFQQTISQ